MLRAPLSVRIDDGRTDQHVTRQASKLRYRRTAPGGFADAGVALDLDPGQFADLGPADKMIVADPDGHTLWEGFLENPAATDGLDGRGLDLSALGTAVLATDHAQNFPYLDRDQTRWEAYAKNVASVSASVSDDPTETVAGPGLLAQFNRGTVAAANAIAQIGYTGFAGNDFTFGAVYAVLKSGRADANFRNQLAYAGPGISSNVNFNNGIVTAPTPGAFAVGAAGSPPAGVKAIALRTRYTGSGTNIIDDDTWTWFDDVAVLGRRMNRYGQLATGAAAMGAFTYVRSDWIVEDLLGRTLPLIDKESAIVEAGTFDIDAFAYFDGPTVAQILNDLTVFEPDLFWEILEHTGNGYRFNYRRWPTAVRYEVTTIDGYDAPGSDVDLCNAVAVFWTDAAGREQSITVRVFAATYPALSALEDAGRVRYAPAITLPDGKGSMSNAMHIGEQVLGAAATLSRDARVTIRRPVVDRLRGGWAMPWAIEPGYPVLVRDTGDVLPGTQLDYDDDAGEAVLTLGRPELTFEQRVARLTAAAH